MEALTGTGAGADGAAEDMLVEPEGCVAPPAADPAKATGERSYPNRVRWYKGVELIWSDMGTTGYKGVSKVSGQELFLAQSTTGVGKGGVGLLGRFPSAEEAALCYARSVAEQIMQQPVPARQEQLRLADPTAAAAKPVDAGGGCPPPMWTTENHVSNTGKPYKRYRCSPEGSCPGKYAQSIIEAWRFHNAVLQGAGPSSEPAEREREPSGEPCSTCGRKRCRGGRKCRRPQRCVSAATEMPHDSLELQPDVAPLAPAPATPPAPPPEPEMALVQEVLVPVPVAPMPEAPAPALALAPVPTQPRGLAPLQLYVLRDQLNDNIRELSRKQTRQVVDMLWIMDLFSPQPTTFGENDLHVLVEAYGEHMIDVEALTDCRDLIRINTFVRQLLVSDQDEDEDSELEECMDEDDADVQHESEDEGQDEEDEDENQDEDEDGDRMEEEANIVQFFTKALDDTAS